MAMIIMNWIRKVSRLNYRFYQLNKITQDPSGRLWHFCTFLILKQLQQKIQFLFYLNSRFGLKQIVRPQSYITSLWYILNQLHYIMGQKSSKSTAELQAAAAVELAERLRQQELALELKRQAEQRSHQAAVDLNDVMRDDGQQVIAQDGLEPVLEDREDQEEEEEAEQQEEEAESPAEPEVDSDEIPEDQIPQRRQAPLVAAVDEELEDILSNVQGKLHREVQAKMKIEKDQVKNLWSDDEDVREQAEQFQCVVCHRFPVPQFILGKEGIKKSSVKIGQCAQCNGLSCFNCWKAVYLADNPKCPQCSFQPRIPQEFYDKYRYKQEELQSIEGTIRGQEETQSQNVLAKKQDKPSLDNDALRKKSQSVLHPKEKVKIINESELQQDTQNLSGYPRETQMNMEEEKTQEIEKYMTLLRHKILLNILFNQVIIHKCKLEEQAAFDSARQIYQEKFEQAKLEIEQIHVEAPPLQKKEKKQIVRSQGRLSALSGPDGARSDVTAPAEDPHEPSAGLDGSKIERTKFQKIGELTEEQNLKELEQIAQDEDPVEEVQDFDEFISNEQNQKPRRPDQSNLTSHQQEQDDLDLDNFIDEIRNEDSQQKQADGQAKSVDSEGFDDLLLGMRNQVDTFIKTEKKNTARTAMEAYDAQSDREPSQQNRYDEPGPDTPAATSNKEEQLLSSSRKSQEPESKLESRATSEPGSEAVRLQQLFVKQARANIVRQIIANKVREMAREETQFLRFKELEAAEEDELAEVLDADVALHTLFEIQRQDYQMTIQEVLRRREEGGAAKAIGRIDERDVEETVDDEDSIQREQDIGVRDLNSDRVIEDKELLQKETEAHAKKQEQLQLQRNLMLCKIADTLYNQEYKYLDYLNHLISECVDSQQVENGCPIERCKFKETVSLKELRRHLVEDCKKIAMECDTCQERMKRPWAEYHDCFAVYQQRLQETGIQVDGLNSQIDEQGSIIGILKQTISDRETKIGNMRDQITVKDDSLQVTATQEKKLLEEIEEMKRMQEELEAVKDELEATKKMKKQLMMRQMSVTNQSALSMRQNSPSVRGGGGAQSVRGGELGALQAMQQTGPRSVYGGLEPRPMSMQHSYTNLDPKEQARSVQAGSMQAGSMQAKSIAAGSMKARSIKGVSVGVGSAMAVSVKAVSLKAESLKAQSLRAQSIKSKSILQDLRSNSPSRLAAQDHEEEEKRDRPQSKLSKMSKMTKASRGSEGWRYKSNKLQIENEDSLAQAAVALQKVEGDIAQMDAFVDQCVKKYKPFEFKSKPFLNDALISTVQFVENYKVAQGQYEGYTYWGQLLSIDKKFEPYGFGILIELDKKIMQLGSFKNGKENGQQRMVASYPARDRQFMQFTSLNSILHGPCLIEKASGRVDSGAYFNNQQHGAWKYRYPDGKVDCEAYTQGKLLKSETLVAGSQTGEPGTPAAPQNKPKEAARRQDSQSPENSPQRQPAQKQKLTPQQQQQLQQRMAQQRKRQAEQQSSPEASPQRSPPKQAQRTSQHPPSQRSSQRQLRLSQSPSRLPDEVHYYRQQTNDESGKHSKLGNTPEQKGKTAYSQQAPKVRGFGRSNQ